MSDLLPASPEAYGVGVNGRGWLKAVLEGRDPYNNFSRLILNTGDDEGSSFPRIDLYMETPVGTPSYTYRLMHDFGNFVVRSIAPDQSINDLWVYNPSMNLFQTGVDFIPYTPTDLGGGPLHPWLPDWRYRDIAQSGFHFLGDLTSRGINMPDPSTVRGALIMQYGGAGEADKLLVAVKKADDTYGWFDLVSDTFV